MGGAPRDLQPRRGLRPEAGLSATFRRRARELAPKVRAMKLRRVAYHEAAHAIVAAHLGLVVDEVGVDVAARPEGGGGGGGGGGGPGPADRARPRRAGRGPG